MKLDRGRFKNWLESHKPDDKAGLCKNPFGCPIAMYLKRGNSKLDVSVGHVKYSVNKEKENTPEWAQSFIRKVDGNADRWRDEVEITYEECLDILQTLASGD